MGIPRDEYAGESRTVSYTLVMKVIGDEISGTIPDLAITEFEKAIRRLNIAVGKCNVLTESLTEV